MCQTLSAAPGICGWNETVSRAYTPAEGARLLLGGESICPACTVPVRTALSHLPSLSQPWTFFLARAAGGTEPPNPGQEEQTSREMPVSFRNLPVFSHCLVTKVIKIHFYWGKKSIWSFV